jgi:predicted nucleotidyltransferase
LVRPGERFYVRRLTAILGVDSSNLSRELARLAELGILTCQAEGRQKYYQANTACPVYPELRALALKTSGMADALRDALAPLAKTIRAAFVYGSMASGESGPQSDVDLVVVGNTDELALHEAISKAEETLGRPVNYTHLTEDEFRRRRSERSGFLSRVLRGPRVAILGSLDGLR